MIYRWTTSHDEPGLLRLAEQAHTEFGDSSPFSLSKMALFFRESLGEANDTRFFLVACDGDAVVGMLAAVAVAPVFTEERVLAECFLFVAPEYRDVETFQYLVSVFEHWGDRLGIKKRLLSCPHKNYAAFVRLYRRLGYTPSEHHFVKET